MNHPPLRSRDSGPADGRFLTPAGAEGRPVRSPVPRAGLAEGAEAEHHDPRGAGSGADRAKGLNRVAKPWFCSGRVPLCNDRSVAGVSGQLLPAAGGDTLKAATSQRGGAVTRDTLHGAAFSR